MATAVTVVAVNVGDCDGYGCGGVGGYISDGSDGIGGCGIGMAGVVPVLQVGCRCG